MQQQIIVLDLKKNEEFLTKGRRRCQSVPLIYASSQRAVKAEVVKPFRYERADCCSHVPACALAYMGLFVFVRSALRIIFSEARRPEPSGLRPGESLSIGVSLQKQLFSFFISFLLPWRSEISDC